MFIQGLREPIADYDNLRSPRLSCQSCRGGGVLESNVKAHTTRVSPQEMKESTGPSPNGWRAGFVSALERASSASDIMSCAHFSEKAEPLGSLGPCDAAVAFAFLKQCLFRDTSPCAAARRHLQVKALTAGEPQHLASLRKRRGADGDTFLHGWVRFFRDTSESQQKESAPSLALAACQH